MDSIISLYKQDFKNIKKINNLTSISMLEELLKEENLSISEYVLKSDEKILIELNDLVDAMFTEVIDSLKYNQAKPNDLLSTLQICANNTRDKNLSNKISNIAVICASLENQKSKFTPIVKTIVYEMYYQDNLTKTKIIEYLCIAGLINLISNQDNDKNQDVLIGSLLLTLKQNIDFNTLNEVVKLCTEITVKANQSSLTTVVLDYMNCENIALLAKLKAKV